MEPYSGWKPAVTGTWQWVEPCSQWKPATHKIQQSMERCNHWNPATAGTLQLLEFCIQIRNNIPSLNVTDKTTRRPAGLPWKQSQFYIRSWRVVATIDIQSCTETCLNSRNTAMSYIQVMGLKQNKMFCSLRCITQSSPLHLWSACEWKKKHWQWGGRVQQDYPLC